MHTVSLTLGDYRYCNTPQSYYMTVLDLGCHPFEVPPYSTVGQRGEVIRTVAKRLYITSTVAKRLLIISTVAKRLFTKSLIRSQNCRTKLSSVNLFSEGKEREERRRRRRGGEGGRRGEGGERKEEGG